jgi:hypothetical protein
VTELKRLRVGILLATVGFVVLAGARTVPVDRIVAGYAIVLAAIALTGLTNVVSGARDRAPSRFEHELLRRRLPPSRPAELVRVEREVTLATANQGHVYSRLRPLLREIVEARLGVDLDRNPEAGRAQLDEETWAIVRPDAPPPADRSAPGLPLRRIRALIDGLERL